MLVWLKYQKYPFWPAVVRAPVGSEPAAGLRALCSDGGTWAGLFTVVSLGS